MPKQGNIFGQNILKVPKISIWLFFKNCPWSRKFSQNIMFAVFLKSSENQFDPEGPEFCKNCPNKKTNPSINIPQFQRKSKQQNCSCQSRNGNIPIAFKFL